MAVDAEGRFLGQDELLYVSATAPATLTDESLYTEFGLNVSAGFEGSSNTIRAVDKAATRFSSAQPGSATYTIQAEGSRKAVLDAGHEIVRDAWVNGTKVYWLISSGVTGHECKHGSGYVTAYGEANSTDEYNRVTCTIENDGAPTFAPVP